MSSGADEPPKGATTDTPSGDKPVRLERALIIDTPIRRPTAAGISLQKITPQSMPATSASITRLRFEAPLQPERPPRLYETIRVIDLARFRQSLRRHRALIEKKGGDYSLTVPVRAALLAYLDDRYRGSATLWPDVVVIRRPQSGVIETNYALLGETIYLGAHLSADWTEGRESERFYETLHQALMEQTRMRTSQFEPVRPKGSTEPGG